MGYKSLEVRMKPSVYGVGYLGGNLELKTSYNGKKCPIYNRWFSMLERCYSKKVHGRFPSYIGCEVSDYFKNFSNFYEWCQNQIGFNCDNYQYKYDGWHLDKDLLIKGNKVYSENTCVFLPHEINSMLTHRKKSRGDYPVGVMLEKGKFRAMICTNGIGRRLGSFDSVTEAFNAYKQAKESYIKEVADRWKDRIDPRAYSALQNYVVNIDD